MSDVFQALAQNRPYRQALTPQQIVAILDADVAAGKLDDAVVAMVKAHLQSCWQASLAYSKL